MHICFIDASTGTLAGGSESIIYNLGLELSKRHEVSLITGKSTYGEILPHIGSAPFNLITVPFISRLDKKNENIRSRFRLPLRFDVESVSLFLGFLRNKEARSCIDRSDVVSFHYPMTSLIFSWYLKIRGIPSVFHTPGHVTGKWFFRFDRSTIYLSNSYDTEEKIWNLTGHHAEGIVTPGIALPKAYHRKQLDIDHPILLNVSRLLRSKGVYRLLDIFYYLKKEIPGAELFLVGQNYEGEGIINRTKALGLEESIHLEGQVPYFEVGKYYVKADLFVHPSLADSFGMVLLEAMSYGVPVVATDLSCFREATQGEALLLPYDENYTWPEEIYILWAREICDLLRNPDKNKGRSEKGRQISLKHTWEKKAQEYEQFLYNAIKG